MGITGGQQRVTESGIHCDDTTRVGDEVNYVGNYGWYFRYL